MPAAQYVRPRDAANFAAHPESVAYRFPAIKTLTVEQRSGGGDKAQKERVAGDGIYDQLVEKR